MFKSYKFETPNNLALHALSIKPNIELHFIL